MGETAQPFWEEFVKDVILPPVIITKTEYKSILMLNDLYTAFKNSNVPDAFILGIYPHQSYNIVATNGNDIIADFSEYGDFANGSNYLVLTNYDPIEQPHAFCFKFETNLAPNGYVLFKIIDAPKNMLFAGAQSSLNHTFPNYDNKNTIHIFIHPLLAINSSVCTIPFLNTYTNTNAPSIRVYSWSSNWDDNMKPITRAVYINYPKSISVVSGALYFIKIGDSDFDKILSLAPSLMYDMDGNAFSNADTTLTFIKR